MVKRARATRIPRAVQIRLNVSNALKKNAKGLNAKEVSETAGYSHQTASRALAFLVTVGCIAKRPGPGNQQIYTFVRDYVPSEDDNLTAPPVPVKTLDISAAEIEGLLTRWSQESWNPKIFHSYSHLPNGLAALYNLANTLSLGSVIDQSDIDEVKEQLNKFRQDLQQTLVVVNSILSKSELWDKSTLAVFLLAHTKFSPDDISMLTRELQLKN